MTHARSILLAASLVLPAAAFAGFSYPGGVTITRSGGNVAASGLRRSASPPQINCSLSFLTGTCTARSKTGDTATCRFSSTGAEAEAVKAMTDDSCVTFSYAEGSPTCSLVKVENYSSCIPREATGTPTGNPVLITRTPTVSTASGSLTAARFSADSVQYLGCEIRGSGGVVAAWCYARDATGGFLTCAVPAGDHGNIAVIQSMTATSSLLFSVTHSTSTCTGLKVW